MIRIDNPAHVGLVMGHVRVMLGLGMRTLARRVANRTGRSEDTVRSQLWAWETGGTVPGMAAAAPYLAELGIGLAFVPLDGDGPKTAPESTLTAEHPSAGVLGCADHAQGKSGAPEAAARLWRKRAINLQAELVATKGPCQIDGDCVRHHLHKGPCAFEEPDEFGDPAGVVLVDDGSWTWRWTPTADGAYSGPHGPDICPNVGCQHEGGAA